MVLAIDLVLAIPWLQVRLLPMSSPRFVSRRDLRAVFEPLVTGYPLVCRHVQPPHLYILTELSPQVMFHVDAATANRGLRLGGMHDRQPQVGIKVCLLLSCNYQIRRDFEDRRCCEACQL